MLVAARERDDIKILLDNHLEEETDLETFVDWLLKRGRTRQHCGAEPQSGLRTFESMNDRGVQLTSVEVTC